MRSFFVHLDPEEEVLGLVRKSLISEAHHMFFFSLWVLTPCFFFFPLMRFGLFGIVFFISLLASGMFYGFRRARIWKDTMLMITDRRIFDIDQITLTKREIAELKLSDISQVVAKKEGVIGKMFDVGFVRIETIKALAFDLHIEGIRFPLHVAELINEVQYISERASSDTFHAAKEKRK